MCLHTGTLGDYRYPPYLRLPRASYDETYVAVATEPEDFRIATDQLSPICLPYSLFWIRTVFYNFSMPIPPFCVEYTEVR